MSIRNSSTYQNLARISDNEYAAGIDAELSAQPTAADRELFECLTSLAGLPTTVEQAAAATGVQGAAALATEILERELIAPEHDATALNAEVDAVGLRNARAAIIRVARADGLPYAKSSAHWPVLVELPGRQILVPSGTTNDAIAALNAEQLDEITITPDSTLTFTADMSFSGGTVTGQAGDTVDTLRFTTIGHPNDWQSIAEDALQQTGYVRTGDWKGLSCTVIGPH